MAKIDLPAPHDFDARLDEAAGILGVGAEELCSIKIRPIQEFGTVITSYLSPSDYKIIDRALRISLLRNVRPVRKIAHSRALIGELEDSQKVLYFEHESGLEIIFHTIILTAGAVGSAAFAANHVIALINNICKMLRHLGSEIAREGSFQSKNGPIMAKRLLGRPGTAASIEKPMERVEELFD